MTHGLRFIQDKSKFCFGCDAVEIANFVQGGARDRAVDLGSGSGIITVLLGGKKRIPTIAVEIQSDMADLARRNITLNGLDDICSVINAPMQEIRRFLPASSQTIVVSNPPYRKCGSGMQQETDSIAIARHEIAVTLDEVVACAAYLLGSGGRFYIVHQTERMAEAMTTARKYHLEPKIVQILTPNETKVPHIFLMKCIKDAAVGLSVLSQRAVRSYGMED